MCIYLQRIYETDWSLIQNVRHLEIDIVQGNSPHGCHFLGTSRWAIGVGRIISAVNQNQCWVPISFG